MTIFSPEVAESCILTGMKLIEEELRTYPILPPGNKETLRTWRYSLHVETLTLEKLQSLLLAPKSIERIQHFATPILQTDAGLVTRVQAFEYGILWFEILNVNPDRTMSWYFVHRVFENGFNVETGCIPVG